MFNNLYGVSLTEPDRVPQLILKLSQLMRYQLEDGRKPQVKLQEEISFIENYIVIEKERVGTRCEITFAVHARQPDLEKITIAPLILITLIENAFKHSTTASGQSFVHINIQLNGSTLTVAIANSLGDLSLKSGSTGIGLATIRERLELLYAGKYHLDISPDESEFKVVLKMQLNY